MSLSYVPQLPEPGQLVDVRHRRYVVNDVLQSSLPPDLLSARSGTVAGGTLGIQHLVTLSSVEDDALGEDLQVIWEIEPGATAIHKTPLPEPIGFDAPHRLDTFLNAVRWGAASSADVKAIQAPFRSGVTLEDYQLDPVARAIQMPRVNLHYTAAPDSEGTLGGLVSLGRPDQLGWHIDGALEAMEHCASDPLCAEHSSKNDHTLHEAACHACMFILKPPASAATSTWTAPCWCAPWNATIWRFSRS